MKNKMRAVILMVALGGLGILPAWTQQQPEAKDAKTKCACCEHKASADVTDKKDATQHSGSVACCQEMKKQRTACCGMGGVKTEGQMGCCKEAASCCAAKDAKMCQSKESCCAGSDQCPSAKATAK